MTKKINIGLSIIVALGLVLSVIAPVFAQTETPPTDGSRMPPQPGMDSWMSQIADALQMTVDDLNSAIKDGKTIATLAADKSVDLTTLIGTLTTSASERLASEVTDGKLTQAQADQSLSDLKTALNEWFTTGTMPEILSFDQNSFVETNLVAEALGLSVKDLQDALKGGKTISQLAADKGISLDTLISQVSAKRSEVLQQAVQDGKLTQDQVDKILSDLKTDLTEWFNTGKLPQSWRQGGMRMGNDAIAQALGITVDELTAALKAGKTIVQLAEDKGITLDTLASTLLSSFSEQLKSEVTDGKLTQAEADQRLASMKSNLIERLQSGNVNPERGTPPTQDGTPPASNGGPGGNPGGNQPPANGTRPGGSGRNRPTPAPTSASS